MSKIHIKSSLLNNVTGDMDATKVRVLGRYLIEGEIGKGGMGMVFRAYDRTLERHVAIKLIQAPGPSGLSVRLDPDHQKALQRFQQEARAAANVRHPNVVQVYELQTDPQGFCYLVMEYVRGETLSKLLARRLSTSRKPFEPREAIHLVDQVLQGLGAVHQAGFVHRDIKPSNVMVTAGGGVVVVDFGVVKDVQRDGDLTRTSIVPGSVSYMAPEQINREPIDARTDIYAVGVLLYSLLVGTLPFEGDNDVEVLQQHLRATVPSLGHRCGRLSGGLDAIIARAMAKVPQERFQSAQEMRRALQNLLSPPAPKKSRGYLAPVLASLAAIVAAAALLYERWPSDDEPIVIGEQAEISGSSPKSVPIGPDLSKFAVPPPSQQDCRSGTQAEQSYCLCGLYAIGQQLGQHSDACRDALNRLPRGDARKERVWGWLRAASVH